MLRPRWRKVLADLWASKARALLVVASITVGVMAIGVIAGVYVTVPADMTASYQNSNPRNIEILTDPFDDALVRAVAAMPGVRQAEGRRTVAARLILSRSWDTIELRAVPCWDALSIARPLLVSGQAPLEKGTVVLTTKTAERHQLRQGDSMEIELLDGTRRTLRVTGLVMDLSGSTSGLLNDNIGLIGFDALEWVHVAPAWDRLLVTVSGDANDTAHIRAVAAEIEDRLERTNRGVYHMAWSRLDRHPLGYVVTAMIGVLGVLGVLLVLLSGALITNTFSALLGQHVRQIGIIKLIGGRRDQIIAMYAVMIVCFSAAALAVAIPVGAWGAYALSAFVADLISFTLRPATLCPILPFPVAVQATVAMGVPLAAGLLPVLRGTRLPVQLALTAGDAMDLESGPDGILDRWLHRIRARSRPFLISLRNTFRRKGRLALTLVTLTLGGGVFVAVLNAQVSLDRKVADLASYFSSDVNLDFARPYATTEVAQLARAVPGVTRVEAWSFSRAELLDAEDQVMQNLRVVAPPEDTHLVSPSILEGRWLRSGDERALAVCSTIRDSLPDLAVGDVLRLRIGEREADWTVVGVFEYSDSGDALVYTTHETLSRWLRHPGRSSAYRILAESHELSYQAQLAARLDSLFRGRGYRVARAEAGAAFAASLTDILSVLTVVLMVMALLTALVGSIGLAGTLGMNVMERTREIGVMRAIGAHDRLVMSLVLGEGALIGAVSYVLGGLVSFPITYLLSSVISRAIFGSPAQLGLTWAGFALWLVVVALLVVAASLIPARSASRLTIREVLAYE